MYSEKVMEHFHEPRNQRRMENPDGLGKVGNPICGDVMWLYIKVNQSREDGEVIEDISWETFGCTAAIATSSMVTDLAKGKTLDEALEITNSDVAEELEGLPPVKMHCSVLASDALNEAIYDYYERQNQDIPPKLQKRHDKIKEDMEKIKEEYSDYVGMEEEVHNSPDEN